MIEDYVDEKMLRLKYVDEKKSTRKVAKEMGVSAWLVFDRLNKMGLIRSHSEATFLTYKSKIIVLDEERIMDMYNNMKLSTLKIAAEFGVSAGTIRDIVRKLGTMRGCKDKCYTPYSEPLSEENQILMVEKYLDEGKTIHEISKEMHIDAQKRLHKLGVCRTTVDRMKVKALYENGMPTGQIAEEMGISRPYIYGIIKKFGCLRSKSESAILAWRSSYFPTRQKVDADIEEIKAMYIDGETTYEIAQKKNLSRVWICRALKEFGLIRSGSEAACLKWQNPQYVKNVADGLQRRPTNEEIRVDTLIQENSPGEFEYNGDYRLGVSIGGKTPDWVHINGQKKVIEYNGCFVHCCPQCGYEGFKKHPPEWTRKRDKRKLETYSKHGFETLVIWGHDSDEVIIDKARAFVFNGDNANKEHTVNES